MIIEDINELDGLSNELVTLRLIDTNLIKVVSRFNKETIDMVSTNELMNLQKFGINVEYKKKEVKRLRKATLEVLESVADENLAMLFRTPTTQRWMLKQGDNIFHIEPILEEIGYYL